MDKKSKAGGFRTGSGRPAGTGKYGERTQPIRIPISLLAEVEELVAFRTQAETETTRMRPMAHNIYPYNKQKPKRMPVGIPLFNTRVAAGLPSPADDHIEEHLDLNEHLVEHPSDTFFVRVEGESMLNAGIHPNDILIVDRSIQATDGKIVVAVLNNELTVKRLELKKNSMRLLPENDRYRPITITEAMDFLIWGVVIHVIHSV